MPSDTLGDQVGDHLCFFVAAAVFAGTDIEAFDLASQFLLGLLTAELGLIEEGVVGVLRHEGESVDLVRGLAGNARGGNDRAEDDC